MDFIIKSGQPEKQRSACLIAGVFEAGQLTPAARRLDRAAKGYISKLIRQGEMAGKIGQTLLLHHIPGWAGTRLLLVGCGKEQDLKDTDYRKIVMHAIKSVSGTGAAEADNFLAELNVKDRDLSWKLQQTVLVAEDQLYRFDQLKSRKENARTALRKLGLFVPERSNTAVCKEAVRIGKAIASGVKLTKDLGNLPGNVCTPSYLARQAQALAKGHRNLTVKVLNKQAMERLGMGALLAVARGTHEPPRFITLEYRGGKKGARPIVLVGKGITFDSGGISIKPAAAMDEMKYDMCGAASVLGTMTAVMELKLPINLVGVIPSTENLPGGSATKPGDIVTSLSGQTVEILNTDAEGRLILCDALTYSERFNPEVVIDIATLTGACVIALGNQATGLLSNHAPLAQALLKAGQASGDRAWELPLWEEYQDQLKSNFADMANVGGREGGTITAACFLSRYTKKFQWAHLDIAGTAWRGGDKKGATGRPVPLLMQYLLERAK